MIIKINKKVRINKFKNVHVANKCKFKFVKNQTIKYILKNIKNIFAKIFILIKKN